MLRFSIFKNAKLILSLKLLPSIDLWFYIYSSSILEDLEVNPIQINIYGFLIYAFPLMLWQASWIRWLLDQSLHVRQSHTDKYVNSSWSWNSIIIETVKKCYYFHIRESLIWRGFIVHESSERQPRIKLQSIDDIV